MVIPLGTIFPDSEIPASPDMVSPAQGDGGTADSPSSPAPPSFTLSGDVTGLTILIDFYDVPGTVVTQAQIDDYMNKPGYTGFSNAGSVYDYFFIQSGGKLRYNNNVTYYVRVPKSKAYYNDKSKDSGLCGRLILNDALDVLIANGYDFSQLTTKPVSGKNYVRACNVLFAGADSGVWSQGLWPHRWTLSTAKLVGTNTYINDYQITEIGTSANLTIGTFCHENGHMLLGYPDLYSYDDNAANMGNYSLMAGGNSGGSPGGTHPTNIDSYLKEASGWMNVIDLNAASQQRCTVQVDGNQVYRYNNPAKATEYFLFEVRDNTGYEGPYGGQTGSVNPSTGLVTYHVYETGSNPHSSIFTASNPNCSYAKPYELMVVEANQKTTITPWYDSPAPDTSDAFKASGKSSISDTTTPDLKFWVATSTNGGRLTNSGCNINSISADSNVMTFVVGSGSLGATPSIVLSSSTLYAYCNSGANAAPESFAIGNGQGGTLNYTITTNQPWLSCTPATGSVTTGSNPITVNFATSGLAPGNHTATITVTDPSASPNTQTIAVSLTVTDQPYLSVSPASVTASGYAGLSGPRASLQVWNSGGGTLNYSASEPVSWISLSPASGLAVAETDTVYVNFDATLLTAGTYTTTITVASPDATNAEITIPVTFTVQAANMVVTSPNGWENWVVGTSKTITWSSTIGGNVTIDLLKAGVYHSTIIANTPNDGSQSWTIPSSLTPAVDYKIRVTSVETPGITDQSDLNFVLSPDLPAALDTTGITWSTSGNANWFAQVAITKDGVDAAECGNINNNQTSTLQATIAGPGTLTFWWKVSSEALDYLRFYLDNVEQVDAPAISAVVDWTQKTITIPPGSHIIKWTYAKNGSVHEVADTAWVDKVVFTSTLVPEIAVEQPANTGLTDGTSTLDCGAVNLGNSSSPFTCTIRNTGLANLTGLSVSKTGTHSADYTVGALGATTLAPGASTTFTVTFAPGASGPRTAALQIASNDYDENPFDINLIGTGVPLGTLDVTVGDLASTGNYGGAFSPASKIYTLTNIGSTPIDWTAAKTAAWVSLDSTLGTLAPGATTAVTASINVDANSLVIGSYSDTVSFNNTSNSNGNTTRGISLTVNPIAATVNLGNLLQIYNGSPKPVTVTTTPSGFAYSVTYDGLPTVPTNAGTYAVVATVTEPNYTGSASGSLTIAYNVTYLGNGNTSGVVPADQTKYHNVDLTLAANTDFLDKTDFSFSGWNTAADGSGISYPAGASYTGNASLTLYAQWSPGANGTWIQTATGPFNWSDSSNWSGGVVAAGSDRTASFTPNITIAQVVNLDTARTIGNITFTDSTTASNDLTISGANALTLARTTGMPVIDVTQSTRTLTISSQISGGSGLQKNGTGTLTLSGANDYSGGTVMSAGKLAITLDGNLGAANGGITFNGSSSLSMGVTTLGAGRAITINDGVTATFTQGTNGLKTILGPLTGTGTLAFSHSTRLSFQNSSNGFSGEINTATGNNLSHGIEFASIGDGVSAGLIKLNNGSFRWINTSGGATTFANRQFALSATTNGGIISAIGGVGSTLVITKDLLVTGDGNKTLTLAGTNTGTNTFAGNITNGNVGDTTDVISLTKAEAGTWALSGTNTYSGDTNLSAASGTLTFSGSQSLSPNTTVKSTVTSVGSTTVRLLDDATGTINFSRPFTLTGGNTSNAMTIFVGNNGGAATGSTAQIGTFTWNTAAAAGVTTYTLNATGANGYRLATGAMTLPNLSNRTVGGIFTTVLNPTTASLTVASVTMAAGNAVSGGIPVLELGGSSGTTSNFVTGIISDASDIGTTLRPLNITKTGGTSTWTLQGVNTYTGATTVTAGKLFINGNQTSATGAVSVEANATLGGTGTIGGNVTVAASGKLEFDISTVAASHNGLELIAGKALTLPAPGASVLTITSSSGAASGTYTLITGGNNIIGVAPATVNLPAGWIATVSISGNSLLLNVTSAGYSGWANGNFANGTLGDKNMASDPDGDGLSTGIEWVVGGDPTLASDSTSIKPVFDNTSDATYFIYSYRRSDLALADSKTIIAVEYGSDLTGWASAVDANVNVNNNGNIEITEADNVGVDMVNVKIKRSLAPSGKLFARLKVVLMP